MPEPEQFHLTIHLGNAEMQDPQDIAQALIVLGERMAQSGYSAPTAIKDGNGNTVGAWELEY